jgi:outer membrane immunogenic protein
MRNLLLKGLVFAGLAIAGPAVAADLPLKAPPPIVAPAFSWTGFYVGVNGGGAWGHSDMSTSTIFDPAGYFATTSPPAINAVGAQHINTSGGTFGGQLGFNRQFGAAVLGIEADIEWLGLTGSATGSGIYPCCAPTGFTVTSSMKTDWLFTLRPRLGFAADHWLFYVTGGLAVGDVKSNFVFTDTFATALETASISQTKVGWTAGVGAEYAVAGPWSVKVEYLHVDLGTVSTTSNNLTAFGPPRIPFPTNVFSHSSSLTSDIVRAGINMRF